jgi:hypothetical protein
MDHSSMPDALASLIEAVKSGLKENSTAIQDLEKLQKAKRLGPQCCTECQDRQ